jgi:integrase
MARGHIERLKTGWRVAVYAGKDPVTGRKRYVKETHPTEAAAQAARERLVAQLEADAVPDRTATVAVLMRRWLEVADHEHSTAHTARWYVNNKILPTLGEMPVRKLQHRVDLLDRFYTHLRRCGALCDGRPTPDHTCKPMAPSSVRHVHALLSAALGYAVSWGWIERNPAEYAHPPKLARRQAVPPEPDEVARLLNAVWAEDAEFGLFLWLAVTTGARRGELAGLRWHRVRLDRAELHIAQTYLVRGGQRIEKAPKTDTTRRLALDVESVNLLTAFRAARADAIALARLTLASDSYVFSPDPAGERPWHPDHFSHAYRHAADRLGITQPLKNLRHFNATQLLAAGVDLRTTAGRLGHSDGGATTLRVYADWTRPADEAAATRLASNLGALRAAARSDQAEEEQSLRPALPRLPRDVVEVLPGNNRADTYHEIVIGIREAIRTQRIDSGDPLPPLRAVAERYRVSPSTARRAFALLGREGLLTNSSGRWVVRHGCGGSQ